MIKWIKAKLAKSRNKQRLLLFVRGYQYASGELVRTSGAAASNLTALAYNVIDANAFDEGMLLACQNFTPLAKDTTPCL